MIEPRKRKRWKLVLVIFFATLALVGGAAFSQRTYLLTWFYAYQLERSSEGERQKWADRLVEMGEPAAPRLIACLQKDNENLCTHARASLEKLLSQWGPKDERSGKLADRFFEAHPGFSPAGQIAALQLLPEVLAVGGGEAASKARTIVSASLKDRSAEIRFLGVTVAMNSDLNMLPALVPLLDDVDPRVRRAAMRVLGPLREGPAGVEQPLVSSDELLRWLHDPDPEVRQLCEMSLKKSRGLADRVVRFGRMLTHADPMQRLQLLLDLNAEEDVDVTVWLKRLSNDSDSAVRAGSARVAAERRVEFADRLEQMIDSDPDGTVRKIAAHYRGKLP